MGRFDLTKLRYLTPEEWRILNGTEMGMKNHELVPLSMVASLSNLKRGGCHKLIQSLSSDRFICWENSKRGKITGYRLTWAGYDHLAFRALSSRGTIHSVGKQIGVGKESDVYIALGRDLQEIEKQKDIERLRREEYLEEMARREIDDFTDFLDDPEEKPNGKIGSGNRFDKKNRFTLSEEELKSDENTKQVAIKIHRLGRTSFRNVKNLRDYSSANHTSWIYLSRLAATREYSRRGVL